MMFLFLLLGLVSASPWKSLSTNDLRSVTQQIRGILDTKARSETGRNGASTAACWVRLAFHDCGTWNPTARTGGCHAHMIHTCSGSTACEKTAPENAGLPACVDELELAYMNTGASPPPFSVMSRADFWHLAASTAVAYTSGDSCQMSFQFGRTDAQIPKRFANTLPGGTDSITQLRNMFITRLGFTMDQMICLFGAHSLGQLRPADSGFNGQWLPNGRNFTNNWFKVLVENRWRKVSLSNGLHQWQIPNTSPPSGNVYLHTDLLPMWDVSATGCPQGSVTLDASGCPLASTSAIVESFADSATAFCSCFQGAWNKMIRFGGDTLANPGTTLNQPTMTTSITLTPSTTFAAPGDTVTIRASVRSPNTAAGLGALPVGTAVFTDNGAEIARVLLLGGDATLTLRQIAQGRHTIGVTFTADTKTSFSASSGTVIVEAGDGAPSTTTTPAPTPTPTTPAPGSSLATTCAQSFTSSGTFTLRVTNSARTVTGGTVTFTAQRTDIANQPLVILASNIGLSNAAASLAINPPLALGSWTITGTYSGTTGTNRFATCNAASRVRVRAA